MCVFRHVVDVFNVSELTGGCHFGSVGWFLRSTALLYGRHAGNACDGGDLVIGPRR